MAKEKEENLKSEPQRGKRVILFDYLDKREKQVAKEQKKVLAKEEKNISSNPYSKNKRAGIYAFLKLPKEAEADRLYLDTKMKEYNARVGGGL